MSATRKNRITITVGKHLDRFLKAGGMDLDNTSAKIDGLAARYLAITQDAIPKRWSPQDWLALMRIVRDSKPISDAIEIAAVASRLRQLAKDQEGNQELNGLAYRYESLRLAEQMAAIEFAETAIRAGANGLPELTRWLRDAGHIA
jgi:hypothetical protein